MTSLHYGLDGTLLSAPGSPYAFSTALKPPGALNLQQGTESDVAGRLSLGSVGSTTPPLLLPSNEAANNDRKLQSPNETALSESLGILDLDAMEDSGVSQFLSSPNGDGLQLKLSVATSARSSNIIPLSNQMMPTLHPPPSNQMMPTLHPSPSNQMMPTLLPPPSNQMMPTLHPPPSNQMMPTLHPPPSNQMMPTLRPPPSNQALVFNHSFNQMISAAPPLSSELDESGSSEGELALSAGDLEQLDVTLTDESDRSFTHLPGQNTLSESITNGPYNPFEDYDPGSFGGEEFEAQQDQASFLHELKQQEEAINKATLTPSDSRLTSFTSACPQSDLSLNSYFNKKSNEMGQLSDELSPSQRPQFTDTPSHVILSPTATDTTPKEPSSIVFNGLTPALSSHSTLPPTPPQLDLSEPTSLDQGLPSMYFHNELPPSNQQTPTGNSVGGLPSQYLQMEQLSLKDTPCHLEASQSLHLCSQYLQLEDSTLVFPELSAISSLPPEAPYSLATPPSAYLPLGFEVTSVGNQLSFTTTATDESVKTITTDASHVTSEEDHVIRHGSPININLSSVSTNISGSCEQSHQVMVPNGSLDVEALLRSQPIDVSSDLSNITTSPPHNDHTPPHTVHTSSTFHTTTTSVHHSPSPERTPAVGIPPEWLEVCQCLEFSNVVCVGSSQCLWMDVSNKGDRWIQVTLLVAHLTRDGQEVSTDAVFTLTQRLFIGPGSKERVKVTFAPVAEGVYSGVVSLQGSLVVSSVEAPLATVKLCGHAESPRLTIPSSQSLDYGTVVGGSVVSLPLELSNVGSSLLPLKVTINCNDPLHRMYFTLADTCPASPPSPRAHPNSVTLSLPPHPHNKPHPLHIELSAPKFYHSDTTRPPLKIQGSLDIALDSVHTTHNISSLPIHAVVGVAKLLAPGSFQGNDFTLSCLVGQTKTERVPLKNAGNIPLTVTARTSHPTLFLLSPHTLTIEPGQESYVDVTFAPISDPVTSEMTLQLHVNPTGPDYNLNVRGVAIPASKQRTVSWNNKTLQSISHSPKTKQISQWLSEVSSPSSHPTQPPSLLSQPTPPSHSTQPSHPTLTSHPSHPTLPSQPAPPSHSTQPSHLTPPSHPTPPSQLPQEGHHRRTVYIREEEVLFPPTPLNTRSTVKVQVCNRDLPLAVFTVLKPALPFTIDHRSFKLGSRQCARLPIHFTPAMPGKYSSIVALRTDSRHQMFVVVRGESPKP